MTARRWLALSLFWAVAAGGQQARPSTSAPRIAVDPAGFDFGSALQERTLHKEFSIKNFGGSDLVIEGISTTCGCTVGQLDTKTIKPGASVTLRVSLETRASSGAIQRSVLIRSNDPAHASVEVKLTADVKAGPTAK